MGAFALVLAGMMASAAQQAGGATDEYIPPPPPTHTPNGIPYCDAVRDERRPPTKLGRRIFVCAQRPVQMVRGRPTEGSPWQVEILSTFQYTPAVVAEDEKLEAGKGKLFLAQKPDWERRHRCGGALIAPDLVLTAAHCVVPAQNGDVRKTRAVRVGANNLASSDGAIAPIAAAIVHPDYNPTTYANDIALVRLDWGRSTPLRPTIPLAGPGQPDATPGRGVSVTGWGLTEARAPGSDAVLTSAGKVNHASAQLQELSLTVQPAAACAAVPQLKAASEAGAICALADIRDADSCQGDSGGPLVLEYRTRKGPKTILVGIVSQGIGCAWHDTPAVYTRVSQYRDWIAAAAKATGSPYAVGP